MLVQSRALAVVLTAGGAVAVAAGAALVSVALGLAVLGVLAIVGGLLLVDVDERERR